MASIQTSFSASPKKAWFFRELIRTLATLTKAAELLLSLRVGLRAGRTKRAEMQYLLL
jgi:hypothetical protein